VIDRELRAKQSLYRKDPGIVQTRQKTHKQLDALLEAPSRPRIG
jgi:hypothetical protein